MFNIPNNTSQLNKITHSGTAKPVVPILESEYLADQATYDAQDVIWAIHKDELPD